METKITQTRIIGSNIVILQAWEPSTVRGPHSTITHMDGQWYGRIGTDPDPTRYQHLRSYSQERYDAYKQAADERYNEAYRVIIQQCPEAAGGRRTGGEIVITRGQL